MTSLILLLARVRTHAPTPVSIPIPNSVAAMAKLLSGFTRARYNMATWAEIVGLSQEPFFKLIPSVEN